MKNKTKYCKKNNIFDSLWEKYINLYSSKGFRVKELMINPKSSISLQKHIRRSKNWTVISNRSKITNDNKKFFKNKMKQPLFQRTQFIELIISTIHRSKLLSSNRNNFERNKYN